MSFFIYNEPVYGQGYYFGREHLVRSLDEGIHQGRSFVLCGGPKTGRSSTLLHVEHRIRDRWPRKARLPKVVPIYLSAGALLATGRNPATAVGPKALWQAIRSGILDGSVLGDVPVPQLDEPSFVRVRDGWVVCLDALARMDERLRGTAAWCRYALLVDDADLLLGRGAEREFEIMGAMLRGETPGGPFSVVLAGGRLLREALFEGKNGPLAGARPLLLGTLRESEAAALVRSGLPQLDERVLDELLRLSGRHPWVLQRLLAELELQHEACDIDAALDAARDDLAALWEGIWAMLDLERGVTYRGAYAAPEHALLQLLLDYGTTIDVRTAELQLGIKPLKEVAELLDYLGVAERVLKGDVPYWRAHFELWNNWYADRILE